MADYAIGDIQGCYEPLQRLLKHIDFDCQKDKLWFVGDLINRGPQSLEVLRFIKNLAIKPIITLGNHDLHLLGSLFTKSSWKGKDDTIARIINAPDGEELGHWLRQQHILYYSPEFNVVMCHAGISPLWDLSQAMSLARELERALSGDGFQAYLSHMYGNKPELWSDEWVGFDRLRAITNYFTRMRFCDAFGRLDFAYKGTLADIPANLYPWYEVPVRKPIEADIIFGHWAALMGKCPNPRIHALDTGCLWGGKLTALRLQDRQRFCVPGLAQRSNG